MADFNPVPGSSKSKRIFDDTPEKERHLEIKKTKAIVTDLTMDEAADEPHESIHPMALTGHRDGSNIKLQDSAITSTFNTDQPRSRIPTLVARPRNESTSGALSGSSRGRPISSGSAPKGSASIDPAKRPGDARPMGPPPRPARFSRFKPQSQQIIPGSSTSSSKTASNTELGGNEPSTGSSRRSSNIGMGNVESSRSSMGTLNTGLGSINSSGSSRKYSSAESFRYSGSSKISSITGTGNVQSLAGSSRPSVISSNANPGSEDPIYDLEADDDVPVSMATRRVPRTTSTSLGSPILRSTIPIRPKRPALDNLGTSSRSSSKSSMQMRSDETTSGKGKEKEAPSFQNLARMNLNRIQSRQGPLRASSAREVETVEIEDDISDTSDLDHEENQFEFQNTSGLKAAYEESQREIEELISQSQQLVQPSQISASGEPVYEEYSKKLIAAHADSLDELLRTALDLTNMPCDSWVAKRKASPNCDYIDFLFSLWMMIAAWDPLILMHFVHGDIPRAEKVNSELHRKLAKQKNLVRTDVCPSIYVQYLVDSDGSSPPPRLLLKILDHVELYARGFEQLDKESSDLVAAVDQVFNKGQRGSGRAYIVGSPQHKTCLQWVKNLRERLQALSPDDPLPRPLCEVGYATRPTQRLESHSRHESSNYLMNLTEAICSLKFPRYKIVQYVVFKTVHVTHAMYAEIIASRFALTYTTQGGGFCHFIAGVSHSGAEKATNAYYSDLQTTLSNDPYFNARVSAELAKIESKAELSDEILRTSDRLLEVYQETVSLGQEMDDALSTFERQCEVDESHLREIDCILDLLDPEFAS